MRRFLQTIATLALGDREAARTIPKTGFTAWLSAFTAAAMTFLAVIALAYAATMARVAEEWVTGLAGTASVRIAPSAEALEEQIAAVLRTLQTTPGIVSARLIPDQEQMKLLAPWLGENLPAGILKLPRLIEVTETEAGPDLAGLVLRLAGEAPDAVYNNHGKWRTPLVAAALRLKWISYASLGVILAVLAAVVALAVQAALSANARIIETLRLVGARDAFVVRAFVRRYTLRAFSGAALGAAVGAAALLLLATGEAAQATLAGPRLAGGQWLWVAGLPPASAIIAFVVARITTLSTLRRSS